MKEELKHLRGVYLDGVEIANHKDVHRIPLSDEPIRVTRNELEQLKNILRTARKK